MHTKKTYKDARTKPAVVYWIHYVNDNDPYTQGYVGISTNVAERFANHKRKSNHIGNRIANGAVLTILCEAETLIEAAQIENQYRPSANIGWNITAGGDIPPSREGKISPKTKLTGSKRTSKQKEASSNHSLRMKGRKAWNAGAKGLQKAWNKGMPNPHLKDIANIPRECPHCGKTGKGSSMLRWHFDNCKNK